MGNTTKKLLLFWTLALCFCGLMPSLCAQSALLSVSTFAPNINDSLTNLALHSVDGPYLFREKNGSRIVTVVQSKEQYQIIEEFVDLTTTPTLNCVVDNPDKDAFSFSIINKIRTPKSSYKQPEKLLAISDIEGNFDAFYGLLTANGVMDKGYNWTYGKGHLVLIGDFMDRGDNVTQVLWLIYKLEQEAEKHGGLVHFILGNHEVLNLEGLTNYVDKKYIKLAQKYSGKSDKNEAYLSLMANNQELVTWMKSKNSIEKIGNTLFVHGGISPELVKSGIPLEKINSIIRRRLNNGPSRNKYDKMDEDFLMASHGPLWYRGLAIPYRRYYNKCTETEVNKALRYFNVDHIAIGHTIAKELSLDFDGKVIRTDVKHGHLKDSPYSQALLITENQLFKVDAAGKKVKL